MGTPYARNGVATARETCGVSGVKSVEIQCVSCLGERHSSYADDELDLKLATPLTTVAISDAVWCRRLTVCAERYATIAEESAANCVIAERQSGGWDNSAVDGLPSSQHGTDSMDVGRQTRCPGSRSASCCDCSRNVARDPIERRGSQTNSRTIRVRGSMLLTAFGYYAMVEQRWPEV